MAVAVEAKILGPDGDWVPYGADWVDRPERGLHDLDARYQAFFFIRYLDRLMERQFQVPNFSCRVWLNSETVWKSQENPAVRAHTPFSALQSALDDCGGGGLKFCSADPNDDDVFASRYCFDSYFAGLAGEKGDEGEVFGRFHERAVTRSWTLKHEDEAARTTSALALLGCRYFRFFPAENARQLAVRVEADASCNLKVELALAAAGTRSPLPKCRVERSETGGKRMWTGKVEGGFSSTECDHAVLVVTHCLAPPGPGHTSISFAASDAVEFDVSASCA